MSYQPPPQQPGQPWQPQQQPYPAYPQQPMPPQPGQWQAMPPQGPYQPMQPPPPKKKRRIWLWIIAAIVVIALCNAISHATQGNNSGSANATAGQATTAQATLTQAPTQAPAIHYPPKTLADLRDLAAKGDANAIQGFHSESVGLTGVCPQPKRLVTVTPGITGQQLTEDLLAYFFAQQLDSPCGSQLLAYHSQSEGNDVYTVALMNFDVADASGQVNTDPNASRLMHKLTIDIGGFDTHKEYVVAY